MLRAMMESARGVPSAFTTWKVSAVIGISPRRSDRYAILTWCSRSSLLRGGNQLSICFVR